MTSLNFGRVQGLDDAEQQLLAELSDVYNYHQSKNATKDKYYEGQVTLGDVSRTKDVWNNRCIG